MVKGVEYFIVIAFCFAFVTLWILIHTDRGTKKKIVMTLIPLSLIFAGGAITLNKYFSSDLIVSTQEDMNQNISDKQQLLDIDSDYFSINYGQATEFHKIMSEKIPCSTCHHNSKDIQACKNCHGKPFNLSTPNIPGIKAAYHQMCENCHKDKFNGPQSCKNCHNGKTLQISTPLVHSLTWENCNRCHTDNKDSKIVYHDNCVTCHTKTNVTGAIPIPIDHIGRDNSTCQGCHKQKGG